MGWEEELLIVIPLISCRQSTFHGKDGKRYTWRTGSKRLEVSTRINET